MRRPTIILTALSALLITGCNRSYKYSTPEGAIVEINIAGGDSTFGSLQASKTGPDGDTIELVIENWSFEQKLADTIAALTQAINEVR